MQELLISYITSDPGYAIIIAIVLSIFIFWTKQEWNISGNPRDGAFEDNLIVLKGRGFSDKYFKLLVVFLQTFDKLYSKPEKGNRPNLVRIVSLHYFTAHSFERCLLIAFSYTQLLVLLQWVLIGSSSFGAYEILNTNIDLQYRLIYAACLFFLMLMCYWSTKAFHQNNSKWPTLLLFCIYFVFSNSETADAISNVDFSFAFLGIGAALYLGAFSAAAVFIGISLGLIGVYFYFFYIVEYIFLSDHLNELFESEDPYILFGITLPITLFGTFLCVLFFKYSYRTAVIPFRYLQSKFTENRFYLVAWVFLVIFTVYFVHIFLLSVLGAPGSDEEVSTWVVTVFYVLLLGCLPLGNAVFDWVSVNITRALLKKIEVNFQSDNMMGFFALFGWIIFDLIAALILLMGVLFFTALLVHGGNVLSVTFSGPELIDIKNVKDRMFSENWYELGWLWIMFVSTLIPTILHLFVVLLATIQGVFSPFSQTTVNRMESAILSASSSSDINSVVHRYARFGYMFFCYGPKLLLLIIMVLVFRKIYDYRFDIYAFFDSILDVFLEVVLWL